MTPFEPVTSRAVPLPIDNLDTDVITPIGRVLEGPAATLTYAFESLRYGADGALRPECPLNDPAYEGAQILIAGANFGCGSSRETAVWAVHGMGFRVVIAPSFGDIFFSNCFKNGVLPIVLAPRAVAGLMGEVAQGRAITVDLEAQTVSAGELQVMFEISAPRKEALRLGLDDLGIILRRAASIDAFESADRRARPWVHGVGTAWLENTPGDA